MCVLAGVVRTGAGLFPWSCNFHLSFFPTETPSPIGNSFLFIGSFQLAPALSWAILFSSFPPYRHRSSVLVSSGDGSDSDFGGRASGQVRAGQGREGKERDKNLVICNKRGEKKESGQKVFPSRMRAVGLLSLGCRIGMHCSFSSSGNGILLVSYWGPD